METGCYEILLTETKATAYKNKEQHLWKRGILGNDVFFVDTVSFHSLMLSTIEF